MNPLDYMPPIRQRNEMTAMMAINEISRLFGRTIRASEKPDSAMSQDSFRLILIALSNHDGITQLELSNLTHLKPPTISITVGKMESLGYVTRIQDEKDMRSFKVYLTQKGKQEHDEHLLKLKSVEAEIVKELSDNEREQFMDILMKMRKSLFALNGIEYHLD